MKKTLILPECEWILTDEAKNDSRLNPTDKNVLAVLQCVFDKKNPLKNGYYAIILYKKENAAYSLQGDLEAFGFSVSESTVWRSVDKLYRLGYLDYKRGFWSNTTNSGQPSKIKIFKGTNTITDSITVNCEDIENTEIHLGMDEKKLSSGDTDTCIDIENRKAQSQSKSESKSEALPLAPYSYSDIGQVEDTTFVGEGNSVVDIKAILDSNVCNENVMGDLLEWTIKRGWFVTDIQVKRVVEQTQAECGMMKFNEDQYTDMFKAIQKKADRERLTKIIHT